MVLRTEFLPEKRKMGTNAGSYSNESCVSKLRTIQTGFRILFYKQGNSSRSVIWLPLFRSREKSRRVPESDHFSLTDSVKTHVCHSKTKLKRAQLTLNRCLDSLISQV